MLARSSKRRRRRQNSNMLDPNAWKQDCALLLETMLESDDSIPFRHAVDIDEFPVSIVREMTTLNHEIIEQFLLLHIY